MWTLCAIRVKFLWNLCEIFERRGGAAVGRTRSAKLSHEEPERPSVELDRQTERRLCRTTKRSGRGSNSFDKTVERWSAAAVGRTRSTRLSSDELPRFQRGCYSLLWICHQERILHLLGFFHPLLFSSYNSHSISHQPNSGRKARSTSGCFCPSQRFALFFSNSFENLSILNVFRLSDKNRIFYISLLWLI